MSLDRSERYAEFIVTTHLGCDFHSFRFIEKLDWNPNVAWSEEKCERSNRITNVSGTATRNTILKLAAAAGDVGILRDSVLQAKTYRMLKRTQLAGTYSFCCCATAVDARFLKGPVSNAKMVGRCRSGRVEVLLIIAGWC